MNTTETTAPTPQALLSRAAEIIEERGWVQAEFAAYNGCVCAVGAIRIATAEAHDIAIGNSLIGFVYDFTYRLDQDAYRNYRSAEALADAHVADIAPDGIAYWNDQYAASADEVVAVLRAAAAAAEGTR